MFFLDGTSFSHSLCHGLVMQRKKKLTDKALQTAWSIPRYYGLDLHLGYDDDGTSGAIIVKVIRRTVAMMA